jgi:pyruvate kinase
MTAALPEQKTKIVATIGPASESPEMLVRLIRVGVNVARLNFSHGDFSHHAEVLCRIRDAARETSNQTLSDAAYASPRYVSCGGGSIGPWLLFS